MHTVPQTHKHTHADVETHICNCAMSPNKLRRKIYDRNILAQMNSQYNQAYYKEASSSSRKKEEMRAELEMN